jgi:mono/diheme cytochrome c family protein
VTNAGNRQTSGPAVSHFCGKAYSGFRPAKNYSCQNKKIPLTFYLYQRSFISKIAACCKPLFFYIMGKLAGIIWIIIAIIIVVVAGIGVYVSFVLPNVGKASDVKIETTAGRIARGKYLANNVAGCIACHSKRDWSKYAAPVVTGTIGGGGERFDKETDFPGTLYAKNITPYALHHWSDAELIRAITEGVTKNGEAIYPLMPYKAYAKMYREDVYSIIAYLRTLPSIKNDVPPRSLEFPFNFMVNTVPEKTTLAAEQDTDRRSDGRYLVTIANCVECHSQMGISGIAEGTQFGGGWPFQFPNGTKTYAANITPDNETGIGKWSREFFINRFRQYADSINNTSTFVTSGFNTTMPWKTYAGMTDEDLSAIYLYLRTVKTIKNKVEKFGGK